MARLSMTFAEGVREVNTLDRAEYVPLYMSNRMRTVNFLTSVCCNRAVRHFFSAPQEDKMQMISISIVVVRLECWGRLFIYEMHVFTEGSKYLL